jgi:hypothetical protein
MIQSEMMYAGSTLLNRDELRLQTHSRQEWNELLFEHRQILARRSSHHRDDSITVEEAREQVPWMM